MAYRRRLTALYFNAPFLETGLLVRVARFLGIRIILQLTLDGQDGPYDLVSRTSYPDFLARHLAAWLGSADVVLTMGEGLRSQAIRFGWAESKVEWLPQPKSRKVFFPARSEQEKAEARRQLGLPQTEFLVGFVGHIERHGSGHRAGHEGKTKKDQQQKCYQP